MHKYCKQLRGRLKQGNVKFDNLWGDIKLIDCVQIKNESYWKCSFWSFWVSRTFNALYIHVSFIAFVDERKFSSVKCGTNVSHVHVWEANKHEHQTHKWSHISTILHQNGFISIYLYIDKLQWFFLRWFYRAHWLYLSGWCVFFLGSTPNTGL